MASPRQSPLTADERQGIQLAVQSAFTKLRNLYLRVQPIFEDYGFAMPSAGVIARDLSEKIEKAIVQHCPTFTKGTGHCDLLREGCDWEVKICKDSGLTINQSKQVRGENYIVVNYKMPSHVRRIFVLWNARDEWFSERRPNTNARGLQVTVAADHIETILDSGGTPGASKMLPSTARPVKAVLRPMARRQKSR